MTAYPKYIILVPTRELALQVYEQIVKITFNTGIQAVKIFGGERRNFQYEDLKRGADIIVGTPGRMLDFLQESTIDFQQVKHITLDEADRMLDMGFEKQIDQILFNFSKLSYIICLKRHSK